MAEPLYTNDPLPADIVSDQRKPPFFWADKKVLFHFTKQRLIDAEAFLVYCCLCTFAGEDRICFPAVKTLARRTGLAVNTVRIRLLKLKDAGLIKMNPRKDPAGDQATYLFVLTDLRDLKSDAISEEDGYLTARGTSRRGV